MSSSLQTMKGAVGGASGLNTAETVVIGGIAGSVAEMCVQPALVVRTRMMVQGVDKSGATPQYSSFAHALRSMYSKEGFSAFYKGGGINAAFTPAARGLFMAGVDGTKAYLGDDSALKNFAAGMNGQLLASIAYVPRDIVVERCAIDGQVASTTGSASSSFAALRTVFATEGWYGFYRAFLPHQMVWIPFNGLFFSFLGMISDAEKNNGFEKPSYALNVINTFLAAGLASLATNPIDVVKTRLQVAGANPELFGYSGPLDCAVKLLRSEGPLALFAGCTGRFMYLGPGFAIWMPTYDLLKRLYLKA